MRPHPGISLTLSALLAVLLVVVAGCDGSSERNLSVQSNIDCGDDAVKCIPCEAGDMDCDGATLIACKPDGRGYAVSEVCETAQLCGEGLVTGACAAPQCGENEVRCVGAVMQVCAAGRHRFDLIVCETEDACIRGVPNRNCAEAACSAATDCTGQDTECRRRACDAGQCVVENLPADTACTLGGVNGVCDGQGACRPSESCAIPSDCPGQDTECRVRACVAGQCGFTDLPEGIACETTSVTGTCNGEGACLPAADCTIASDCAGEDTQCRIRACVQGVCGFADLPMGSPCDVGGVVGACNGGGTCQVTADCTIASDCPGTDNDCRLRACTDGMCTFDLMDQGVTCSVDGYAGVCDGVGGCTVTQQCRSDGECNGVVTECQRPACVNGRCTTRNLSGTCRLGNDQGICQSGGCVCSTDSWVQLCSGSCTNTLYDINNCGECGFRCTGPNEDCAGGQGRPNRCVCQDDYRRCPNDSGTCTYMGSVNSCGSCNTRCAANAECVYCDCGCPGFGCKCISGYKRCYYPNAENAALEGECVREGSPEWTAAACRTGNDCGATQ